jgi:phosphatidylinositol alpha-1,6-mannosyltransferase
VRERGIERILCGRALPEGWLARAIHALDGVPYECFVHGEEVNTSIEPGEGGFLLSRRHRIMSRFVFGRASRLIASSVRTARIMQEQWGIEPRRVRVLLPGVDTAFFRPDEGVQLPDRLADWAGRRVVLSASRLQKRKGHDMLIRAVGLVRERVPEVLLEIVGAGVEAGRLRALVEDLDLQRYVSFRGEVDDANLRSFYQHCDVFVLANRQVGTDLEGFGMVLLEAQACATPVIAGSSGGTSEALVDGKTGFVVDCANVEALADRIVDLLSDDVRRRAMGTAARALMLESFDWDVVLAGADWLFERPGA